MKSSSMQASWIIGTSDQGFYNKDDVGEGGGGVGGGFNGHPGTARLQTPPRGSEFAGGVQGLCGCQP